MCYRQKKQSVSKIFQGINFVFCALVQKSSEKDGGEDGVVCLVGGHWWWVFLIYYFMYNGMFNEKDILSHL